MVLDLKLHAEFRDHSVVEISTIICDNPFEDVIPTYKIMFGEPNYHILCNKGE